MKGETIYVTRRTGGGESEAVALRCALYADRVVLLSEKDEVEGTIPLPFNGQDALYSDVLRAELLATGELAKIPHRQHLADPARTPDLAVAIRAVTKQVNDQVDEVRQGIAALENAGDDPAALLAELADLRKELVEASPNPPRTTVAAIAIPESYDALIHYDVRLRHGGGKWTRKVLAADDTCAEILCIDQSLVSEMGLNPSKNASRRILIQGAGGNAPAPVIPDVELEVAGFAFAIAEAAVFPPGLIPQIARGAMVLLPVNVHNYLEAHR